MSNLRKLVNSLPLYIIIFVGGAAIMILELIASRIVAPYVGTSIFVWTSLIGIILGCLSLGYYLGGKIADRLPYLTALSIIILITAIWIGGIAIFKDNVLIAIADKRLGIKIGSIISTIILFAVPSILLGMISPYAAKLKIKNLAQSGATVGTLYALSTLGSIGGTFLAGFYLIPKYGNKTILYMLTIMLVVLSIIGFWKAKATKKYLLLILLLIIDFSLLSLIHKNPLSFLIADIDTPYNRVWIEDTYWHRSKKDKEPRPVRFLKLSSHELYSAMYLDGDDLVFEYSQMYHLDKYFNPNIDKALLLGGGAYSTAKDFMNRFPEGQIDSVEIDPQLTKIAYQYFV